VRLQQNGDFGSRQRSLLLTTYSFEHSSLLSMLSHQFILFSSSGLVL
jgi:hypothetical protein